MVIFIDAVTKITANSTVWNYPNKEILYKALNITKKDVSNKIVSKETIQTETDNKYKNLSLKELLSIYEQRFLKK